MKSTNRDCQAFYHRGAVPSNIKKKVLGVHHAAFWGFELVMSRTITRKFYPINTNLG